MNLIKLHTFISLNTGTNTNTNTNTFRNKLAKLNGWLQGTMKQYQSSGLTQSGDSQSFQKSPLDGDMSTNIQILAKALLSGF